MKIARTLLAASTVAALAFASAGCAENKAATAGAKAPTGATGSDAATTAQVMAPHGNATDASVETPNLHVSDAIARACGLPQQAKDISASFEFDSAAIGETDREMLSLIAKCVSEGPLKGSRLALTGRADPRGEDEYNMTLGEARADSVRRYLHDLGVQDAKLTATSRGELDATGSDDATWARDRRVDIDLASN